jgi:hypothetical protein
MTAKRKSQVETWYRMVCDCGHSSPYEESRPKLYSHAIASGWKLTRDRGWVCVSCAASV